MRARTQGGLFGLASAALLLHIAHFRPTWTDDAFITFRYARNLAEGRSMVFNEGEAVEGLTNLAWAVALAPFADGDILWAAQLIGVLATLGTLALLTRWASREALGPLGLAATLASVVLIPWVPYWSWQGLETPVVMFLVTLGWTRYHAELRGEARAPLSGLGMGLAPAFRPDAALLALLIGAHHLVQREGPRWGRAARRAGLITLACAALLIAAKLMWFGELLPNTLHAKTQGAHPDWGRQYLITWLTVPAPYFPALAVAAVAWGLARPRRAAALPAMVALAWIAMCVAVSGDLMPNFRMLVPAWPALAACVGLGARDLALKAPAWATPAPLLAVLLACVPSLSAGHVYELRNPAQYPKSSAKSNDKVAPLLAPWERPGFDTGQLAYWSTATAWMLVHAPDDATLSFTELGLFSWLNTQRVLDPLGLTDPMLGRTGIAEREERWRYFADRVDLLAAETTMGWWETHSGYLAREAWQAAGGCGSLWVLVHPDQEVPGPQPEAVLKARLRRLLDTTPRMSQLHIAVARELADAKVDGPLLHAFIDELEALAPAGLAPEVGELRCDLGLVRDCPQRFTRCELRGERPDPRVLDDPEAWPKPSGGLASSGAPLSSVGPDGDLPLGRPEDARADPDAARGPPLAPGELPRAPPEGAKGPPLDQKAPASRPPRDRAKGPPKR